MTIKFTPVLASELQTLISIRIEAMRESLERLGRFDPERAAARLRDNFDVACTRHIERDGERVGFVVVRPVAEGLLLDHLYVLPRFQNFGAGAAALEVVMEEADQSGQALRLSALKHSPSNRFYLRHGFTVSGESEWDIHYLRKSRNSAKAPLQTTV